MPSNMLVAGKTGMFGLPRPCETIFNANRLGRMLEELKGKVIKKFEKSALGVCEPGSDRQRG